MSRDSRTVLRGSATSSERRKTRPTPRSARAWRLAGGTCAALALTVLVAGCGGAGGNAGSESSGAATVGSAAEGDFDAKSNVEALFAGTFTQPPSDSPAPASGKNVWLISLDQSLPAAAAPARAAEEAAKALGWDITVFDSKSDPAAANNGINQAVAAGADAVVSLYWDCSTIKAGLLTAKSANVTRVAIEADDCPDSPLYDHVVSYNNLPDFYGGLPGDFRNFIPAYQRMLADYLIARGSSKILFVTETDLGVLKRATEAALDQLSKCTSCEVVNVPILVNDYGPNLQQKVQQALLKNPDIDAVMVLSDTMLSTGVIAALKSANLWGKVAISGGEGSEEMVAVMRDYPADWAFGIFPVQWDAYASMDALNRIFNGQQPVAETGMGLQLVDHDHNLPATGNVLAPTQNGVPIDFAAAYEKAWASGS